MKALITPIHPFVAGLRGWQCLFVYHGTSGINLRRREWDPLSPMRVGFTTQRTFANSVLGSTFWSNRKHPLVISVQLYPRGLFLYFKCKVGYDMVLILKRKYSWGSGPMGCPLILNANIHLYLGFGSGQGTHIYSRYFILCKRKAGFCAHYPYPGGLC